MTCNTFIPSPPSSPPLRECLQDFTPLQRKRINREIDEVYESFLSHVAQGRNLTVEQVPLYSSGHVHAYLSCSTMMCDRYLAFVCMHLFFLNGLYDKRLQVAMRSWNVDASHGPCRVRLFRRGNVGDHERVAFFLMVDGVGRLEYPALRGLDESTDCADNVCWGRCRCFSALISRTPDRTCHKISVDFRDCQYATRRF